MAFKFLALMRAASAQHVVPRLPTGDMLTDAGTADAYSANSAWQLVEVAKRQLQTQP